MSRLSLVLAMVLTVCSGPTLAKPFACSNVPWWIHNYSATEIATVADDLGMTRAQIRRLLHCFRSQDKGIGP